MDNEKVDSSVLERSEREAFCEITSFLLPRLLCSLFENRRF